MKCMLKACVLMVAVAFGSFGCQMVTPDVGQEAVITRKPLLFGAGGLDPSPVKPGLKFVALTTSYDYVSVLPQQFSVHFEDLMSSDGVPLDFDSVIRLRITDSVAMYSHFGVNWYKTNVEMEFMTRVRQAVRKHGMNETAIDTKAVEAIDAEVTDGMKVYLKEANIPAELIQVTVGKANPPDAIKDQRVATAAEQQRAISEGQRKLAEDARKLAETARAASDNAYREAMSLSPDQYLQLETIKMQEKACAAGHCSFVIGMAAQPMLDVQR